MAPKIITAVLVHALSSVSAIQLAPHHQQQARTESSDIVEESMDAKMKIIQLDENETAERGSYCLDGAVPVYYFKKGAKPNKWILAFQGGEWCQNLDDCVHKTTGTFLKPDAEDTKNDLSIFKTPEFKHYNHVVFHHCDAGLSMGDRTDPVKHQGVTLYFRGKRIVDHVLADLKKTTTFADAEEVIITGGSGGGQTTFILSDYLAAQMPKSVVKLGAVPMSGWYPMSMASQKEGFYLHNMTAAVTPTCRKEMAHDEVWKCIHTDVAYQHSSTPMFVIQLLDYHAVTNLGEDALSAWHKCMFTVKSGCDDVGRASLQGFLQSVESGLNSSRKYRQQSEGGFVSTCTKHTFYIHDEYKHYAKDGVTIEKAVTNWWANFGSGNGKWYLPCQLGEESPNQCEKSCDFGTNGEDQHAGD